MAVDRRRHRAFSAGQCDPVDERCSLGRGRRGGTNLGEERVEACPFAELNAGRVLPFRPVEIARQRDVFVSRVMGVADAALRPAQNLLDRHARVGGDRDEGGIGAVLEKAAHQISEEIAVAADRRIDAAGGFRLLGDERRVERFAHAIEALELETFDPARILDHAPDRECVMGGELRRQAPARSQELLHARHEAEVGHRLAGEHRIVGEPALLRPFDLGVPIGALHQPHVQPAPRGNGRLLDPGDHRQGALLVGLHREAESFPPAQRRIAQHGADHVQRKFEAVRLLGVDRELKLVRLGEPRQIDQPRHQLLEHALARNRFIARVQRRKLYGNTRARGRRRIAVAGADGGYRAGIAVKIFGRIGGVARALAQHIE